MSVTVGHNGLMIDGVEQPLLSGEVHPWRVDPKDWERVLDAMQSLGVSTISTYVPWSIHEVEPGRYDFISGRTDITGFLSLISERGLTAIVRPGPDCASELFDSGWPERVLKDERCWSRRPSGQPYTLLTSTNHVFPPSYASRVFLDEVRDWYDAFGEALGPLQWPDGPIVASQVDNEIGYHFQPNTFALDYHPESIAGYRQMLSERYGDIGALNALYGTSHSSFREVAPPTDASDLPEVRRVDWVRWRELHLRKALTELSGMLRSAGIDRVPLIHNDYPRMASPLDPAALEQEAGIDIAAGDIYTTKEGGVWMREFVRFVAGTSRLPVMMELGAGWLTLPWHFPVRVTVADEEISGLRAVCGGIKGVNVYMMVERDRWHASPITVHGEVRPDDGAMFRKLFAFIRDSGITSMQREAKVLVLENRTESRRILARETLGALSPAVPALFPVDRRLMEIPNPDSALLKTWETELTVVLNEQGVDFDRAVSSSAQDLARYEVVVIPTLDAMDVEVWHRLLAAVDTGAKAIVGPRIPSLDGKLQPHDFDASRFTVVRDPSELAAHLPAPSFKASGTSLDVFHWSSDSSELVAVFNTTGEDISFDIRLEGSASFEALWGEGELKGDGAISHELGPWGAEVWRVTR